MDYEEPEAERDEPYAGDEPPVKKLSALERREQIQRGMEASNPNPRSGRSIFVRSRSIVEGER